MEIKLFKKVLTITLEDSFIEKVKKIYNAPPEVIDIDGDFYLRDNYIKTVKFVRNNHPEKLSLTQAKYFTDKLFKRNINKNV